MCEFSLNLGLPQMVSSCFEVSEDMDLSLLQSLLVTVTQMENWLLAVSDNFCYMEGHLGIKKSVTVSNIGVSVTDVTVTDRVCTPYSTPPT